MVRLGAIVLLVALGCVSAVMAIGGLPWRANPASLNRAAEAGGGEAARALTDQAVAQLRRTPPPAVPDAGHAQGAGQGDMQAMTRAIVTQLQRSQGTPLERAVRQAMQADMGDARVERLLPALPQTRPAPRPAPLEQRLQDLVRRSQQEMP
jgi:hypothetical protein